MNAEDSHHEYPIRAEIPWFLRDVGAPRWYLRYRMRSMAREIGRLEHRLNDEFGLLELAPLYAEHADLVSQREAIRKRL